MRQEEGREGGGRRTYLLTRVEQGLKLSFESLEREMTRPERKETLLDHGEAGGGDLREGGREGGRGGREGGREGEGDSERERESVRAREIHT